MKKKSVSTFFILLAFILKGYSQENFRITHGPYLTDMSENGVTVVWTTNNKSMGWVELAPDDGSNFYGYERPKYYDTKYGRIQASSNMHKVRINNLKPGTRYRYAIFQKR